MPGPDPLRRVAASLKTAGVSDEHVADVISAIEGYDEVIKRDAGDLSGLQAILSSWVPEAKKDFEGRRLQAMYRAVSQLKGASVDVYADTVFFTPNPDGETIDVVWLKALVNLVRIRPGAVVKLTSHRAIEDNAPHARAPRSLAGASVTDLSASLLTEFCKPVTPQISVRPAGEHVHYILEDTVFGSGASATIVTCETTPVNSPATSTPPRVGSPGRPPSHPSPQSSSSSTASCTRTSGTPPPTCASTTPRSEASPTSTTPPETSTASTSPPCANHSVAASPAHAPTPSPTTTP